jgi:anaerobic magnesium-protoporphyrin IX monomethyl ester cyclase
MKVALVNPPWDFARSIYFGCREPHLPLELGAAAALLCAAGHTPLMLDAALDGMDAGALATRVKEFAPGLTIVTSAPSYLFWRCAPPELRAPRDMIAALRHAGAAGTIVLVGPHGSTTPAAALRKTGADAAILGECEEAIVALAEGAPPGALPGTAVLDAAGALVQSGGPLATDFARLPPLAWPEAWLRRHRHHHHRFEAAPDGPGAEVEASRGCPYTCSFCAKIDFRDRYRRRDRTALLAEIDALAAAGVTYLYFIDEIFLPDAALLGALAPRRLRFGVQTRIDLWKPELLQALGEAGCVSIEAGVESLTEAGRAALDKKCRMSTEELADRLIAARRHVPFVQANLIGSGDPPELVAAWRDRLRAHGVWANDPVPLYPYPGSPDYRRRWGLPDDQAWERAHAAYLDAFAAFSDIQDEAPLPLPQLEAACVG